jgi:hypothetical protein
MVRVFDIDQSQRRKECNSRWLVFTQDRRFSHMGKVRCCRYSWPGQRDSVKSWVDVLFDRHSIAGCSDCGNVPALGAADARAQPSRHGDMHARGGEGRLQDGAMDSAGGQTCVTSEWRARGRGDRGTAGLIAKRAPHFARSSTAQPDVAPAQRLAHRINTSVCLVKAGPSPFRRAIFVGATSSTTPYTRFRSPHSTLTHHVLAR